VQDDLKDLKKGKTVSVSLYNLQKKYGGVVGLARKLKTDLKVIL